MAFIVSWKTFRKSIYTTVWMTGYIYSNDFSRKGESVNSEILRFIYMKIQTNKKIKLWIYSSQQQDLQKKKKEKKSQNWSEVLIVFLTENIIEVLWQQQQLAHRHWLLRLFLVFTGWQKCSFARDPGDPWPGPLLKCDSLCLPASYPHW
jgi:hypothetical protein